jgi:predicted MFS family arabinose efflux permease
VPIGVVGFVLTTLYVPRSRAARARRLDPAGQVLVILALASLTYAIIEAPRAGWTSFETLGLSAFSLACFVALVWGELRRREPLLEIRFFRSAPFSGASTIAICAFAAQGGFLFLNTLYLQGVRHLSPFHAGLYMLPMAGMVLVFAPVSGRLVSTRGARWPLAIAGAALVIASVLLTRITPTTSAGYLLATYFVFGLGAGLINPPITNTAVSGMPSSQAGVAAAIASTSRQVGMTLGVAVIGAISGGTISGAIGPSFAAATHAGWWICAGLGALCLIMGVLTTTRWAEETARHTADLFHDEEPAMVDKDPATYKDPAHSGRELVPGARWHAVSGHRH